MSEGKPAELSETDALRAEVAALRAALEAAQPQGTPASPWAYGPLPRIDSLPVSLVPPATLSSISLIEKTVTTRQASKVEDRWTKFAQVVALALAHYLYTHQQPEPKPREVPVCPPQP